MTDNDDRPFLVLSAVDQHHTASSQLTVADCGHQAWISRAGIAALFTKPHRTTCARCLGPDAKYGGAVPGAFEELAAEEGTGIANLARAIANSPSGGDLILRVLREEPPS